MAAPPGGDVLDRLALGPHTARGNRRRWLVPAAVLFGGVLGWVAHAVATTEGDAVPRPTAPALIAGSVEQNLQDPFGPAFVVSSTNTGRSALEVINVTPRGWEGTTAPVRLPAGQSLTVPMDVSVDCGSTPPPSDVVVVRVATPRGARSMDLTLPEVPVALQVEYLRRCSVESLAVPKRHDLV